MRNCTKFYIDGQWVDPVEENTQPVENPATEETIGHISFGTKADVDKAVAAARRAFESFSQTSKEERLTLLRAIQAEIENRKEELATAVSDEMGAPMSLASGPHVGLLAGHCQKAIEILESFAFERQDGPTLHVWEPIGVVGMITPWNWPLNQIACKVFPALATGNTMVLKPSEIAPFNAYIFAEIMDAAGVPAGVFNLVNGDGPGVGEAISGHPDIDMVSFTGSTRAGTAISKNAADTLKKVHLELGGKGANLVFADADEKAVKRGVLHMMNNTGQSCNAPSRMLVQKDIYEAAVETAAEVANGISVDLASKEGRHMGPVVNATQWGKIQDLIQAGIDEGARLVAGGTGRPDGLNKGFFVKPTVFADVNNQMTIARTEIFGPVLSIIPFETEEEALEIANDTVYGLTNYVQSTDGERTNRLARQLRSGMVEINGQSRGAGAPFGGMKQSGNGREGGAYGIEDFLEIKSVAGWAAE